MSESTSPKQWPRRAANPGQAAYFAYFALMSQRSVLHSSIARGFHDPISMVVTRDRGIFRVLGRVALHFGYRGQPQNSLPGVVPRLATLTIIGSWHCGHIGVEEIVGFANDAVFESDASLSAPKSNFRSAFPSISSMFRPCAKSIASRVKRPEVTT